jgi:putative membrane protein
MTHDHHLTVGSFLISATLFLIGLVYLCQWMRVAWLVPDGVKSWRVGSFLVGLLLVWVGLGSPLSFLDHDLLTVHMVQHLLLMTLAPPLILLGAPWKLLPQLREQRLVETIARRHRGPIGKMGRMLLHPVVGWIGATATLVVWHIPAAFMLGLRSEVWHEIEQASFLVTGLLFWWPVIEPSRAALKWPESSILLYLFLATLPCDILSGFLVFCDRVVYPVYLSSSQSFGLSALEDQQCAGALMWTCVTLVYLLAATIVATRLLSPHRSELRSGLQFEPEPSAMQPARQRMEAV